MTTAAPQRRQPVQERSRLTVARILDAAETLHRRGGRRGGHHPCRRGPGRCHLSVPLPLLRRSEEILDQLVTHHLAALDARAVAAERTWQITSSA